MIATAINGRFLYEGKEKLKLKDILELVLSFAAVVVSIIGLCTDNKNKSNDYSTKINQTNCKNSNIITGENNTVQNIYMNQKNPTSIVVKQQSNNDSLGLGEIIIIGIGISIFSYLIGKKLEIYIQPMLFMLFGMTILQGFIIFKKGYGLLQEENRWLRTAVIISPVWLIITNALFGVLKEKYVVDVNQFEIKQAAYYLSVIFFVIVTIIVIFQQIFLITVILCDKKAQFIEKTYFRKVFKGIMILSASSSLILFFMPILYYMVMRV